MPCRCFSGCFNLPCQRKNDLLDFTSEDLNLFTDQLSQDNLIETTPFGELYRAKMSRRETTEDVAVKIMDSCFHLRELEFWQDPTIRGYPKLAKVIGCCREGKNAGIVYDLNPHDTLLNLITRDDFKWLQRVNTALALASLLNFLHERKSPYLIRNFHPAHIVVDQNFTPILFDFGMLTGGVCGCQIVESDIELVDRLGFMDPSVAWCVPGCGAGAPRLSFLKSLALVYDLNAYDTLFNLIVPDDFKWLPRVKVALAVARLLNLLHDRKSRYLIRNINPDHIVLDEDLNPVLFDFGMILGRALEKTINDHEAGTFGYIDPAVARAGAWPVKSDVYAFEVLLLNLMSKRVTDKKNVKETLVGRWALKEYQPGRSLVDTSLQNDPNFDSRDGPVMTDLARQSIDDKQVNRPLMKEVVKWLEALHVVQQYGESCREETSSFRRC